MKSRFLHLVALGLLAALPALGQNENDERVAAYDRLLAAVTPGQTLIEMGDMLVPVGAVQLWRDRLAGVEVPSFSSQTGINKWTGGNFFYAFNANVSAVHRAHFRDAAAEWAMFANLTFTERTSQTNYIMVNDVAGLSGGNSAVGMVGGQQQFNIGSTSWNRGTILHELGHALGLIHEHQRSDRDTFVTIDPSFTNDLNFIQIPTSTHTGAYDFHSIMHYARDSFPPFGQDDIVPLPAYLQFIDTMGRSHLDRWLSRADRAGIAAMYGAGPTLGTVVTSTNDSGPGSLRAALYAALDLATDSPVATPVITFQIPDTDPNFSGGVFTIRPTDRLIGPGARTLIDGTTQTVFTGNSNPNGPEVVLNGASVASPDSYGIGLRLGDQATVVRGFVINGFSRQGVVVSGSGNVVEGCFIGTNASGTGAVANNLGGIEISAGATGNRIGGTTAAARNVISGNAAHGLVVSDAGTSGNVVSGNFVGLNAAGTAAVTNAYAGISFSDGATGNTIGGLAPGSANVISGNTHQGIRIGDAGTSGNTVAGNWIGVNLAGAAVANGYAGVELADGAQGNTVGGFTASARNVISGNSNQGIFISGAGTSGNRVAGNYIGTNPAGTAAVPNAFPGVEILNGASTNTIGGAEVGAGNVISGNFFRGVSIGSLGTNANVIAGNFIGLNATGTAAISNDGSGGQGIAIFDRAQGTIVGGTSGGRNFISGNLGLGILIADDGTDLTLVQGNSIGLNPAGALVPNGTGGIQLHSGPQGTIIGGATIGAANIIAGNSQRGIDIFHAETTGTRISGNSFFGNAHLAINLVGGTQNGFTTLNDSGDGDTGPNNLQNFPVLTSATLGANAAGTGTTIAGSLNSAASATFRVEFFASPTGDAGGYGEGRDFIGALDVTTDAGGNITISHTLAASVPAGSVISATATDAAGNTSEFSQNITVGATDTDGDGLPNNYETANGLLTGMPDAALDKDGDGMSNIAELRAGTSPGNPDSVLRLPPATFSGGSALLSLPTLAGRTYRVEFTDTLGTTVAWRPLTDQILGTGAAVPLTDPGAASLTQRFYRALVLP